jgi:prepilin-type N-terminal cleavage/methylation domain-containing protein
MQHETNNPFLSEQAARRAAGAGFTLLEVLTALAILALASSSVLLVIDLCVNSALDSSLRMEAFRLVRENLEQVLVRDSVEESTDYGTSDLYPDISWQTVIEAFPEPVNGNMWVRAVCTAEYKDSKDQDQKVELTHWIAALTDQQAGALLSDEEMAKLEAEQTLTTAADAAKYAKVNAETLQQWVDNGLLMTEEGGFLKYNLDLFIESNGEPSEQDKVKQVESIEELALTLRAEENGAEEGADQSVSEKDRSSEREEKQGTGEIAERLKQRQK